VTASVANVVPIGQPTAASSPDDRESPRARAWIDAARAGDQAAFGALVELHQQAVFRTALAALGDPADAEDVSQEAFVLAWQKLPGFRGDSTLKTWLLTIVWRKALDRRRSRRRLWQRLLPAPLEGPEPAGDPAGSQPDPERVAVAADLVRRAKREIAGLSPKLRDTLLLAASGEHSYEEIAAVLGVPIGTVKWRVSEARRIIAARWPDRPGGSPS
jgi:RNA polymerase sigma-70 factor (ECF subfamily)